MRALGPGSGAGGGLKRTGRASPGPLGSGKTAGLPARQRSLRLDVHAKQQYQVGVQCESKSTYRVLFTATIELRLHRLIRIARGVGSLLRHPSGWARKESMRNLVVCEVKVTAS